MMYSMSWNNVIPFQVLINESEAYHKVRPFLLSKGKRVSQRLWVQLGHRKQAQLTEWSTGGKRPWFTHKLPKCTDPL